MNQLKTIAQVKQDFNFKGESVTGWARKHGFKPESVKKVIAGKSKCLRGEAHNIAVTLGIKYGAIITD